MKALPAQLPIILSYLNDESGEEKVKERLGNIYGWLESKLARTTDHETLNQLKAKQSDPEVREQWRMILEEAIAEDDLFYEELEAWLNEGVELIQNNDREWYQTYLNNQQSRMETS
ncbi:MAG: hypothetical protein WD431_20815 [Cyclobacteriaceae bacterium]